MILYFADRHMNVIGQASTELPKGLYISDDLKTEEVEAGVATLEFTLNYTASTRNDAKQYGSVGNYILRKNGDEQEFYTNHYQRRKYFQTGSRNLCRGCRYGISEQRQLAIQSRQGISSELLC